VPLHLIDRLASVDARQLEQFIVNVGADLWWVLLDGGGGLLVKNNLLLSYFGLVETECPLVVHQIALRLNAIFPMQFTLNGRSRRHRNWLLGTRLDVLEVVLLFIVENGSRPTMH
jgi:hypothetical protein